MINKVILIGNVGQDPEVRYTGDPNNGSKVATVRLATTEKFKDRNGNPQEHTEWHNVVLWRNLADVVEKYVRKGSQIYIEGRIRTRTWDDQNGIKRYAIDIVADNLQLLGRRSDNNSGQQGGYQNQGYGQPQAAPSYQQQASSYQQQTPAYQQPQQQAPAYQPQPQTATPQAQVEDLPGDDLPF